MVTCPHCGKETTTEPAVERGTLAAGGQAYRQRRQGVRIERGQDYGTDVTPGRGDAA